MSHKARAPTGEDQAFYTKSAGNQTAIRKRPRSKSSPKTLSSGENFGHAILIDQLFN
jgi:hypothetical protein